MEKETCFKCFIVQGTNFFFSNMEEGVRIAGSKNFRDFPHSLDCVSTSDTSVCEESHRAGNHNGEVRGRSEN